MDESIRCDVMEKHENLFGELESFQVCVTLRDSEA